MCFRRALTVAGASTASLAALGALPVKTTNGVDDLTGVRAYTGRPAPSMSIGSSVRCVTVPALGSDRRGAASDSGEWLSSGHTLAAHTCPDCDGVLSAPSMPRTRPRAP